MNIPRRRFIGSSLFVLGSTLLDTLTTPLWKWGDRSVVRAAVSQLLRPLRSSSSMWRSMRGSTCPTCGAGSTTSESSSRPRAAGLAFFDYDNDGWLDIYLTNGSRLDETLARRKSADHPSLQKQSRRNVYRCDGKIRALGAAAGRPAFALATTTTTDGTIYSAPSGDITSSFITTATAPLPM